MYCIATDPNYIFISLTEIRVLTPADTCRLVKGSGAADFVPWALENVRRTKERRKEKDLIGFYSIPDLLEMLDDPEVIV